METILQGDAMEQLQTLEPESVCTCITSPPYYNLRDYGVAGQIGLEATVEEYIGKLIEVFREVRRILRPDGTLWVNIGDCYATGTKASRKQSKNPGVGANRPETQNSVARLGNPTGCKTKDLIGIPWLLAFALRADGWYLRQDIIWSKTNCMPESVRDRCTKSHEYIFLLSKTERYYFDADAIREPFTGKPRKGVRRSYRAGTASSYDMSGGHQEQHGNFAGLPLNPKGRNKRDVWAINTASFKGAHFAVFPERLVEPCILAGCPEGGTVLDPFAGSGTTGVVAKRLGRNFVGCEINPEYWQMATDRITNTPRYFEQLTVEGL